MKWILPVMLNGISSISEFLNRGLWPHLSPSQLIRTFLHELSLAVTYWGKNIRIKEWPRHFSDLRTCELRNITNLTMDFILIFSCSNILQWVELGTFWISHVSTNGVGKIWMLILKIKLERNYSFNQREDVSINIVVLV